MPTSPLQSRVSDSAPLSRVPAVLWDFLRRELDTAVSDAFGADARAGFTASLVVCAFARHLGFALRPVPVAVVVESAETGPAMTLGAVDAQALATIEASRLAVRASAGGLNAARAAVARTDWGAFLHAQRRTQFPVFPDGAVRHIAVAARDVLFDPGFGARLRWRLRGAEDMPVAPTLARPIGLSRGRWVVAYLPDAAPGHSAFWVTTGDRPVRRGDRAADHRRVERAAQALAARWSGDDAGSERPLAAVLAALGGELRALAVGTVAES